MLLDYGTITKKINAQKLRWLGHILIGFTKKMCIENLWLQIKRKSKYNDTVKDDFTVIEIDESKVRHGR